MESFHLTPTQFIGKEDMFKQDILSCFVTNTIGPFYAINAFLPLVRAGQTKKIVVMSIGMADPDFALEAGPMAAGHIPYCVSKAALNMIVSKFAAELRDEGVTMLSLSPGVVATQAQPDDPMYKALGPLFKKYDPSFSRPIMPEESVHMMLKVIDSSISIKDSGALLSHFGSK